MRPGKSTTLRRTSPLPLFVVIEAYHHLAEFQRLYTPTAFREERILWRAVIQLNIVRSVRTVLDALTFPSTSRRTSPYFSPRSRAHMIFRPPLPNHPPLPSKYELYNENGNDTTLTFGSSSSPRVNKHPHHHPHSPPSNPDSDGDSESDFVHPHQHIHRPHRSPPFNSSITLAPTSGLDALKARLLPLWHIEALLIAKLVPPNEEEATYFTRAGARTSAGASSSSSTSNSDAGSGYGTNHVYRNQEIFVRPGQGWKGGLARARVNCSSSGNGYGGDDGVKQNNGSGSGAGPTIVGNSTGLETQDELQEVLNICRSDMIALWRDEGVRDVLRRRKIRLEEGSGL